VGEIERLWGLSFYSARGHWKYSKPERMPPTEVHTHTHILPVDSSFLKEQAFDLSQLLGFHGGYTYFSAFNRKLMV
jgi:hypothetical protein